MKSLLFVSDGYSTKFVGENALHDDVRHSPTPSGLLRTVTNPSATVVVTTWYPETLTLPPSITLDKPSELHENNWTICLGLHGTTIDTLRIACMLSSALVIRHTQLVEDLKILSQLLTLCGECPEVVLIVENEEDIHTMQRHLPPFPCKRRHLHIATSLQHVRLRPFTLPGNVLISPRNWVTLCGSLGPHRGHREGMPTIARDICRQAQETTTGELKSALGLLAPSQLFGEDWQDKYHEVVDAHMAKLAEATRPYLGISHGTVVDENLDAFARNAQELVHIHYVKSMATVRDHNEKAVKAAFRPCEELLQGVRVASKEERFYSWDHWAKAITTAVGEYSQGTSQGPQGLRDGPLLDALLQWVIPNSAVVHHSLIDGQAEAAGPELQGLTQRLRDSERDRDALRAQVLSLSRAAVFQRTRIELPTSLLPRASTLSRRQSQYTFAEDEEDREQAASDTYAVYQQERRMMEGYCALLLDESDMRRGLHDEEASASLELYHTMCIALSCYAQTHRDEVLTLQSLVTDIGHSFDAMVGHYRRSSPPVDAAAVETPAVSRVVSIEREGEMEKSSSSWLGHRADARGIIGVAAKSHHVPNDDERALIPSLTSSSSLFDKSRTFSTSGALLRKPRQLS